MLIGVDGNEANVEKRVGSNLYTFELLRALDKLKAARKHEWMVYLKRKPLSDMPAERGGWRYRVIGPGKLWTRWRLPLDLWLHRPQPEVFFSPGHYTPRWCPMRLVCSVMDLGYLRFPDQFRREDLMQLTSWTAESIKKATCILAISKSTKREIEEKYPEAVGKVVVTHLGYDRELFDREVARRDVERVREKYRLSGDYVVFVSTLKPSKNIEGLLSAWAQVVGEFPKYKLVVCGKKGWMWEGIWGRVKDLSLEKKVIFTGYVAEGDLPGMLAGARAQVLVSFWEGFGKTIPESMAVGTLVVASNVGSLPEVVDKAGILVDPYKTESIVAGLVKMLGMGKREYNKLVQKGYAQAEKFDWEKTAKKTLRVVELVGREGGERRDE